MTENEAINNLACMRKNIKNTNNLETTKEIIHNTITSAIAALEEVQQYRAIGTVEECQKVIEEQHKNREWIPCNKRLPEENQTVIACFITGAVTELRYSSENFQGMYCNYSTEVIVAWQPLPEPYKTGE